MDQTWLFRSSLEDEPDELLEEPELLPELPPEHHHCAILTVSALYRTIGQYLVERARS